MAESGWPGFVVTSWNGIAAPTGTPREIVNKLNSEITAVLQLPEMRDRFRQMGMEAAVSTPEGMAGRLNKDVDRWRDVISKYGLRH